jgi:hypothetical protein
LRGHANFNQAVTGTGHCTFHLIKPYLDICGIGSEPTPSNENVIDVGVGFIAPLKQNQKISAELRFTSGHTFLGNKFSASNRTLGFTDNLRSNEKVLSLTVSYILDVNVQEGRKGKSTKDKEVNRKRVKKA